MVIGCKGICNQFLTSGGGMISRYRMGFKRCTECNLFIKYEGIRCPCCSHVLRTKSRSRDNLQIGNALNTENIILNPHELTSIEKPAHPQ